MFDANLVILAQICDELACGKAEITRILNQWPPFSIPTESIPWCMFGANLVIPAQISDELLCGQCKVYGQTDGQTDTGYDNTPLAWKAKG